MNIMVILDVQLWELGTQRLHQGLSETILVYTLTHVREFKKYNCQVLIEESLGHYNCEYFCFPGLFLPYIYFLVDKIMGQFEGVST